jgi:hypothetical protein
MHIRSLSRPKYFGYLLLWCFNVCFMTCHAFHLVCFDSGFVFIGQNSADLPQETSVLLILNVVLFPTFEVLRALFVRLLHIFRGLDIFTSMFVRVHINN